jgi:hypothetical protein
MYKWIDSNGKIVKTKTIREFSDKYGINYSHAKTLACGLRSKHKGWCSTSPRAKKARERFTTVLLNLRTGEREIVGQSPKKFALNHSLCPNELLKLLNKHRIIYRDYCLASTLDAAYGQMAAQNF